MKACLGECGGPGREKCEHDLSVMCLVVNVIYFDCPLISVPSLC